MNGYVPVGSNWRGRGPHSQRPRARGPLWLALGMAGTLLVPGLDARVGAQQSCDGPSFEVASVNAVNAADGPYPVVVGDFNEDGHLDLVVASESTVFVLLGTGTGAFGEVTQFSVGYLPYSVAVADFNGDGHLDLATANEGETTVSVLLGTGTGDFGGRADFTVGNAPTAVAAADFNGDGRVDLAATNQGSGSVSVLLGTGTGSFGEKADFPVGDNPFSVAVGDFNGDGRADLAVGNYASSSVSVLLGTGTGSFGERTDFPVGRSPRCIVSVDLNGDGRADLATVNHQAQSVSVLLGTGTGSFGARTDFSVGAGGTSVAIGDFNTDGHPDLAAAGFLLPSVSLLLGNGTGSFARTDVPVRPQPYAVAVGDFNGDGLPDLAVATFEGQADAVRLSVLLNTQDCTQPLTVTKDGPGSGSVVSSPAGIDCGVDCSEEYSDGTVVTLVATPADGSAFLGWAGAGCSGTGACILTMDAARSVTATFGLLLPVVQFGAPTYTVSEGRSLAVIPVSRTGNTAARVTVQYATGGGSATPRRDYVPRRGTLTFDAGVLAKTFAIPITDDRWSEPQETVGLALSNPTGGAVLGAQATAILTIVDDDPALSIDDVSVTEGNTGATQATFTVTLSIPSSRTVTVDYATANWTATAWRDYIPRVGRLRFAPGQTSKTVSVAVKGDTIAEPDESYLVTLSRPVGATLAQARGKGTIVNDDPGRHPRPRR
jgi:hypothetical protein